MKNNKGLNEEKQFAINGVVKSYRVEAISINEKQLHNEVVIGFDKASDLYQDLKIKYYQTYTFVEMTEL